MTENLQRELVDTKQRFYPLTFDFGISDQVEAFKEEYFKIITFRVLRNHIAYFKRKAPETMKAILILLKNEKYKSKKDFEFFYGNFTTAPKKLIGPKCKDFVISLLNIQQLMAYWKCIIKNKSDINDDFKIINYKKFSKEDRLKISKLAEFEDDFDTWPINLLEEIGIAEEYWKTPNFYLMYKLYKYHRFFKHHAATYSRGSKLNTWIIKPSAKSKGAGIKISNSLNEILSVCKDNDRIVQKYVELPLTIDKALKFDIRVWVLISSVNPLVIYYYTDFYARVCPKEYSIGNLDNIEAHLTNYSLTKNLYSDKNESVRSRSYLVDQINKRHGIDFNEVIIPKVERLIIDTILASAHGLVHRENSFELLGFDILIDQDCKPWLLEVNLSPACETRSTFLKNSLNDMTRSLFQIIQPTSMSQVADIDSANQDPKVDQDTYLTSHNTQLNDEVDYRGWKQIYCGTDSYTDKPSIYTTIEVLGEKLDIETEIKYAEQIKEEYSARLIARFFKSIGAKNKARTAVKTLYKPN